MEAAEPEPDFTVASTSASARARRGVALIAFALIVTVIASQAYLRATAPPSADAVEAPQVPAVALLSTRFWSAFDFISPSNGWAAVVQRTDQPSVWISRTTDGGRRWTNVFGTSMSTPAVAPYLHFFDSKRGLFYAGPMFRTSDGGVHWTAVLLPHGTPSFDFASPNLGWALAYPPDPDGTATLYSTEDAGLTWQAFPASGFPRSVTFVGGRGGISAFDFRVDGEGWAGAWATTPVVYATFDRGRGWHEIQLPLPATSSLPGRPGRPTFSTSVYLLPGHGVLALLTDSRSSTSALTSFDRGQTWTRITFPPGPYSLSDIAFVDATHWWMSRWNLLVKTSDAGRTWTRVITADPHESGDWALQPAHVIDSRHAWSLLTTLVATALATTSDGGVHWTPVDVPRPG